MPHIVRDGFRIAYEIHGHGVPVVMLHGITVSFFGNFARWGWIEQLNAAGCQVVGMDFRGHGCSDKPNDVSAYGAEKFAADVIGLLDQLGIERASLIGYSLGSAIALKLLHQHPARIGPSVLVATGDGLVGEPPHTFAEICPQLENALSSEDFPTALPSHVAAYWTFAVKVGGDRLAALAAARAEYPPCPAGEVARIVAPVLVISGECDPVLGRGPYLAKLIPEGDYVEVPDADHFMLSSNPAVQARAARFLADKRGPHWIRPLTPRLHRGAAAPD